MRALSYLGAGMRKLCGAPGCDELAEPGAGYCAEHQEERDARVKSRKAAAKGSAVARAGAAFYATARWRNARRRFLMAHPLCVDCAGLGLVVAAQDVDHIRPHRGDARLMWDQTNWQALCKSCHSRKTAREVFAAATPGGIRKSRGFAG